MYSTRDKILLAFNEIPGQTLSGAVLAKRLGMTRAAVWKHVAALRGEGFPIQTRKASGYGMKSPFDFSLLKGLARQRLRFWVPHYQFSVRSTQDLAKYAADQGAAEGHYWLAEKQTAGRGRLQRRWESPLGGLWLSLLLRPAIAPSRIPSLTLVAALTLAETIRDETGLPTYLKWPNDIVVRTSQGWKKVAGILTEMSAEVDRTRWVVMGVGVNVNNQIDIQLRDRAVALSPIVGKNLVRADILKAFLTRFGQTYRRFEKAGFDAFRAKYWNHYSRPNEPVNLKTAEGLVRGIARGVDERGALVVESQRKMKTIWEGEIVL